MDPCSQAQLLRLSPAYLAWLQRTFLAVMVPLLAPALAAVLSLLTLPLPALPIPADSQADVPAPPLPPPSPQPPRSRRAGAEVLGPMRINGSVLPNHHRDAAPTLLVMPAERLGEPRSPRFLIEDGVIFEPLLEEDVDQRPKLKGMLRWDLEQLRGRH